MHTALRRKDYYSMAKIRAAVLFGGVTKDHKISLVSAHSVLSGLSPEKYDITPIGITKAGRWLYFPGDYSEIKDGTWENNSDCCSAIISPDPLHSGIITILDDGSTAFKRIDIVFSALHGKYGEGGRIQSLLKLSRIPYIDCNPDTAVYCMDKMLTHQILSSAGIEVPRYRLMERSDMNRIDEIIADIEKDLSYPVYVSATSCSSSIGANIAHNAAELKRGAKIAFSHHHTAIVEEQLNERTIDCVVLGNSYEIEVTPLGELIKTESNSPFASYTGEYTVSTSLSPEETERIKATAVKAFKILNFKGYAKMTFCISGGRILLRRIATIPGFTTESVLPILMKECGYSYPKALDRLAELALEMDS